MDDKTFKSLLTAYAATPHNQALLMVLLRACLERGQPAQAYALLSTGLTPPIADEEERLLVGRVYLGSGHADQALEYAEGESAEALLLRARIHADLNQMEAGRKAYQAAIARNPTLEAMDLKTRLFAPLSTSPDTQGKPGPRLRVISNDNTDELDLDRLLQPETERVSFAQVGGLAEVKEQIRRKIILPFQKPSLFHKFRKRAGGGILLYGPPGCGKTLLARATAGECRAHFYNIAISDVLDMYIGESERKLHALFEKARQTTPAVIFFDEMEALGGKRQFSRDATTAKVVSQFLSEMDGFAANNAGVLILGATNVPWAVDSAFRRPGRFDRVLFVPPPDQEARARILSILLADRPVEGDIDIAFLAKHTSGYSGADLRHIVESAIEGAIEQSLASGQERPLSDRDLKNAVKSSKPTTLEWLTTARNYARYANEAGQYDEVLEFLNKFGRA